jgi:carbamate kinase
VGPQDGTAVRIVLALGGNAILRPGDSGTIQVQTERAREALADVAALACDGHDIALTHGNGPIVGNILIRNEAVRDRIPPMPLYVDDADSQGGIGFLLQSVLSGELHRVGCDRPVATLVTQVLVDPGDPAFHKPTKPVGPPFEEHEAERLAREEGWYFLERPEGVFRRVVPSPVPLAIVEKTSIERLLDSGTIVISCGGGGVPVVEEDGELHGVDAVIDKDLTSSLLARELDADRLVILMEADAVYLDWGTQNASPLPKTVDPATLRRHLDADAFDAGTMAPKIRAACDFAEATARPAHICATKDLEGCLSGKAGTTVAPTGD